jgi:hypothetical protein
MATFLIAVAIGVSIMAVSLWAIRLLATPPPPEPDPEDILEVDVNYRCTVCGLRLTVTHAQDEELSAPRHCREDMEPA